MSTNTKKHRQKAAGIDGGSSSNRRHGLMEKVKIPESERLPLQLRISDFLASSEDEIIIKDLSKTHRKYLHEYALRLGLKTHSYGGKDNREMHIMRRRRLTTLGEIRPLNISGATRAVLQSLLPTIQSQLVTNQVIVQTNANTSHRYRNLRSDSISVALGTRMIPPRAQRISNELFRDKQELPIYHYQAELHQMLQQHNVFIVNGETGSGKTTQVPQYILNEATRRSRPCRIVVTQPRRVAAVSIAHRVAKERGEALGETVGYQIRMESRVKKTSNLIYTTSGCFLRSIMADVRDLFRKVSHIIIDEIHERDKNTDFTLITIKEQLKLNKDLKVILMSATMDIQLLSNYFDNCPVLNVPGQWYDVKIYHLEDILFHTGYRTALMEKYLRSMNDSFLAPTSNFNVNLSESTTADRLEDEYMQQVLDSLIEQCCESVETHSKEELNEMFDQIQYYIESEGMSINAGHSETGITPLIAACKCNLPELVQFLIIRQANVYVRDNDGYEAIDYARLHADGLCLQILMGSTNCVEKVKQQEELNQQDKEKHRILAAYQQQFNDDNEVDHDLILSLLEGLYRNGHNGAIMVFLPGYNDIVQQRDLIQSTLPGGTYKLCILHGHMDSKDQFEALQMQPVRKIILSTNIGQTSITIPDLAYIIDSGKVKMNTYDSITESSQLQSMWISQADACQRSGRAGRTQNGVCYRLYSKAKYQFMPQFSIPEFMRIPLTEICLYAKTLEPKCGVQNYLQKSLNPPSTMSILNAIRKLKILGIFRDDESVTELGKHLVDIPLDVQLGKCLLYGVFLKCYDPILTICAYHSVKDPFILPTDRSAQGQASFQRKSFAGQSFSDQMGILSLHKSYMDVRHNPRKVREFCNKYFLSQSAMEMFCATRKQINDIVKNIFNINYMDKMFNNDWHMIQLCLVAGFYPNVALVDRKTSKLVCGAEKQLILQRTSSLNPPGKKHLKEFINQMPHDWIVFYEKSRIANTCTINMNTVVPSLMIALQCGLDCDIINNVDNEDDDSDDENLNFNDDLDSDSDSQHSTTITSTTATTNSQSPHASSNNLNDFEALQLKLSKTLKNISLNNAKTTMSLDNWIKFDLQSGDARLLLLMRIALHTQFLAFLKGGPNSATSSAAYCIQKLLNSLNSPHAAAFKMTF